MTSKGEYLEIGYGGTVDQAKEQANEWLSRRHGHDLATVGEDNFVIDVGRDLNGQTFVRCSVRRSVVSRESR